MLSSHKERELLYESLLLDGATGVRLARTDVDTVFSLSLPLPFPAVAIYNSWVFTKGC